MVGGGLEETRKTDNNGAIENLGALPCYRQSRVVDVATMSFVLSEAGMPHRKKLKLLA